MDLDPLAELMNRLRGHPNHRVHSIVIVVGGQLVFEEYFAGLTHPTFGEVPTVFDRETKHCLSSVTKSITATLLGRAIGEGFITSENEGIFGFLPDYADLNTGQKSDITLKHLVTMSAGLRWDEWTFPIGDPRNDLTAWFNYGGDLVRFVLERPVVADPGAVFVYASGDLSLRPRDMAKLGQLYLQGGVWEGEQILPAAWVNSSRKLACRSYGRSDTDRMKSLMSSRASSRIIRSPRSTGSASAWPEPSYKLT